MQRYIIMCRSLTYAQRAAAALTRAGITAPIFRAPQELTDMGCGYCLGIQGHRFQTALRVLDAGAVPYGRLFRDDGGVFTEVAGR